MKPENSLTFLGLDREYAARQDEFYEVTQDVMRSGVWNRGPYAEKLTQQLRDLLNVKHVILTANGTQALELIVKYHIQEAGRKGKSYRVKTTDFSFKATRSVANSLQPRTHDEQQPIQDIYISAPLFGFNYGDCEEFCLQQTSMQKEESVLVEDRAQCLGINDFPLLSQAAAYSLDGSKYAGAGQGGFVATQDDEVANAITTMKYHGSISYEQYFGTHSEMDEMNCAISTVRLKYLERDIHKRREIASIYHQELSDHPVFHFLTCNTDTYTAHKCVLGHYKSVKSVDEEIWSLQNLGIPIKFGYTSLDRTPTLYSVFLPIHAFMTEEEISRIIRYVKAIH